MKHQGMMLWQRGVALLAAAALLVLGLVGLSMTPAAHADTTIDSNQLGSITVHALTKPTSGEVVGTGAAGQTLPQGAQAIAGATFKLEKSTVDITTTAGYNTAVTLRPTDFGGKDTTFGAQTGTTSGTGEYTFNNLKPGVYLLTQTVAPAGRMLMSPAVVFVPMTNPANTSEWMYNIHVYPKNADAGKITKTNITPAGTVITVGSTMNWSLEFGIPALSEGYSFYSFKIIDTPKNATAKAISFDKLVLDKGGANVELHAPNDFTIETETPTADDLTVTFTAIGLNKLKDHKGKQLYAEVSTTVNDGVNNTKPVQNAAKAEYRTVNNSDPDNPSNPGIIVTPDDNPTTVKFGTLVIKNTGKNNAALAGGKFKIFQCKTDGVTANETKPLTISNVSEWEITNADTGVSISPLGATEGKLCLVQTTAPNGYQKLTAAQPFTFDATALGNNNRVDVTVKNVGTSTLTQWLPNTGGAGIYVFLAIGLALVIIGVAYMYRHQRN